MAFISEAYQILSDPDKRRDFNENWRVFQECNTEPSNDDTALNPIESGSTVSYSHAFLKEHQSLVLMYSAAPLSLGSSLSVFEKIKSGIYQIKGQERRTDAQPRAPPKL